ncbi:MAG: GC-type dockerin domain-anchored protein [Planctomycetota bacterium]
MSMKTLNTACGLFAAAALSGQAAGQISNISMFTLVEDPASAFFDSAVDSATEVRLLALDATGTPVAAGTDLGFQSVDGMTVNGSTMGFAFNPALSFSIAIDYAASFMSPSDGLSFGFGIGEDQAGSNSAGVAFATQNGFPAAIPVAGPVGGAARVNDATVAALVSPAVSSTSNTLVGSLHVAYDAMTGEITVGRGVAGAAMPSSSAVFSAAEVSDQWAGDPLLVSFFIRSDEVSVPFFGSVVTPWESGTGEVAFSNLRVLSGAAFDLSCPQDIDRDGDVDSDDFDQFIAELEAGAMSADFNDDGAIDVFDLIAFLALFDAGCDSYMDEVPEEEEPA